MPASPPAWLLVTADVFAITSLIMLVMYLFNKLECNKYVHATLFLQVVLLFLALVAYRTSR